MVKDLKILLIGDNERAPYHPIEAVEEPLVQTLKQLGTVTVFEGVEAFDMDIAVYDCIAIYSDDWETDIPRTTVEKIHTYVDNGGGLLFLHSGVSIARIEGMIELSGAVFKEHPDMATMTFTVEEASPLSKGLVPYELFEEPYIYEFDPNVLIDVFMTYNHEGMNYPSGWLNKNKKGKVITLHPGHNKAVFENAFYQKLIQNSVEYICAAVI